MSFGRKQNSHCGNYFFLPFFPRERRTLGVFLSFSCTFGDVRVICYLFSTYLGADNDILSSSWTRRVFNTNWARRKGQDRHGLIRRGNTPEFPTILFAKTFAFPPLGGCQRRWMGQKPFGQLSPKRVDQWMSDSYFQNICRLNSPREGLGKWVQGGQVEAEFPKAQTIKRKTPLGPANEPTHFQFLDTCHVEETNDPAVLMVEKQQQPPERNVRIAISSFWFFK